MVRLIEVKGVGIYRVPDDASLWRGLIRTRHPQQVVLMGPDWAGALQDVAPPGQPQTSASDDNPCIERGRE